MAILFILTLSASPVEHVQEQLVDCAPPQIMRTKHLISTKSKVNICNTTTILNLLYKNTLVLVRITILTAAIRETKAAGSSVRINTCKRSPARFGLTLNVESIRKRGDVVHGDVMRRDVVRSQLVSHQRE